MEITAAVSPQVLRNHSSNKCLSKCFKYSQNIILEGNNRAKNLTARVSGWSHCLDSVPPSPAPKSGSTGVPQRETPVLQTPFTPYLI